MSTSYKPVQVQGTAAATTYATLYTVPAGKEAIISSIVICNTDSSNGSYRIGITTSETDPNAAQWLAYDVVVAANTTTALKLGVALDSGKYLRVSSAANTITFSAFVSEITP